MSFLASSGVNADVQRMVEEATKRAFATALANAKDKVGFLRCPIHRTGATVALGYNRTTKASFAISGCCEDFRKCVHAILGSR